MPSIQPSGKFGKLFLLPSPLGLTTDIHHTIPEKVQRISESLQYYIVEELRTSRRYLKKINPNLDINSITFFEYNEHSIKTEMQQFLSPLLAGNDVGLLSEAGLPCIADPGQEIVRAAHENGIEVRPLTGPSSIITALIASGGNGQHFVFHGYLPVDKNARVKKIKAIEQTAVQQNQTQIFIETPYRNNQLLASILEVCHPQTMLCAALDVTLPEQQIIVKPIHAWKKSLPDLHKRPCVFVLYS